MSSQSERIIQKILGSQLRDESSIDEKQENPQTEQDTVQMLIQLDSERSATIKIHFQDDPFILAKAFCFQYSIDPRVINTLANNIKNVKNMQFNANNQNKSKLQSFADKENNSAFINVSHSFNQSFNKGSRVTNNKANDRSNKNDTTIFSNDCSRQSVFDRLYQDSRKKKSVKNNGFGQTSRKQKKISSSILQESNFTDPCVAIYQKNTKAYKSSMIKRDELYQIKQENMTQGCTFKPQINQISEVIAKRLPQSYHSEQKRQKDMKRIQNFLQQKQNKQLAQCTFEPRILDRSRQKLKSAERYKALHEDSRIRRAKRKNSVEMIQNSQKQAVIKINKISNSIVGDKTFFERLKQNQSKRQEKKKLIQQQIQGDKNRRPSTGRGPHNRSRNVSIGQHLYNQARNKSKQKENRPSTTKNRLICEKSDLIYENTKKTAFQYIFALLDSNQDGLISNTKIQLGRLSGEILKLLTPLFVQLEQMQAELDQYEFVQALNRLFKSFSVPEKQTILNVFRSKSKNSEQIPSFKVIFQLFSHHQMKRACYGQDRVGLTKQIFTIFGSKLRQRNKKELNRSGLLRFYNNFRSALSIQDYSDEILFSKRDLFQQYFHLYFFQQR